jgi:kinetochore protein Nuf2
MNGNGSTTNAHRAKNAEDLPKTERQREINEKLHSELVGMHAEHRKIVEQTEDLKAQRTSLGEDIAMEDRELNQLSQQIKDAKARIVRSPDRIRRHISDMSHHVANERQQHTALVAKSRELAKRLEVYGSLEAELRSLVELEREIETQRTLVDEATKKRTALQSNVEHARIEGESQGERIKQLDRQIKNAEDRVARQKTIIRDSRAEAEAKIQALKNESVGRFAGFN